MKVIIAGGRSFKDYGMMKSYCDKIIGDKIVEVVSGRCRGADLLGERYALEMGFSVTRFPANWKKFGKRAGYIRNEEMAKYADGLICFWDGVSPGTKHMIDLANNHGLKVRICRY